MAQKMEPPLVIFRVSSYRCSPRRASRCWSTSSRGRQRLTVPDEPEGSRRSHRAVLVTVPPLVIFSVPLPEPPTIRSLLLVHIEPAPSTVTTPDEPDESPT